MPLFGLVGMLGVDLFQIDYRAFDVEPDACMAFECRLVLPSFMGGAITCNDAALATQVVVSRSNNQWRLRQEVPGIGQGTLDGGL